MGNGAAYNQLNRTPDTLGQDIKYFDSSIKARQREDRDRTEREGVRADREKKEWQKKWGLNIDDFQNQHTGFNSYDDVARDFSNHAISKYVDLQRKAMNTSGVERRQLETEMSKVKNSFAQFKSAQGTYATLNEDYMKRVAKGEVSGVDSERWESLMQASLIDFNVAGRLDENNNLVYVSRVKGDDGKLTSQVIPNIDLVNGNMTPYSKQNIDGKEGIVNNIITKLGKNPVDKRTGSIIKTSQTFDDIRQKATKDHIDSLVQSDEVLADLAFQFGFNDDKKRTGFSQDTVKQVKDKLFGLVKAGYDTKDEITINTSLARLALDRQKKARQAAKSDESGTGDINPMTDVQGNILQSKELDLFKTGDNIGVLSKEPNKVVTGFTLNKEFDHNGTKIKEVYLDDDGKLIFVGRKKVKGGENKLTGEVTPEEFKDMQLGAGDTTDENVIASKITNPVTKAKFRNKKELVDYLKSKTGQSTGMSDADYQEFLRQNGLN